MLALKNDIYRLILRAQNLTGLPLIEWLYRSDDCPEWLGNEEYCWMHEGPGMGGWLCEHEDCKRKEGVMPVQEKVSIDRYQYSGYHRVPSCCDLRTYWRSEDSTTVVIVTEIAANPGTSITSRAAHLATQIVQEFQIDPAALVYIEHYNDGSYNGRRRKESYAQVTFTWADGIASEPNWKHVADINEVLY